MKNKIKIILEQARSGAKNKAASFGARADLGDLQKNSSLKYFRRVLARVNKSLKEEPNDENLLELKRKTREMIACLSGKVFKKIETKEAEIKKEVKWLSEEKMIEKAVKIGQGKREEYEYCDGFCVECDLRNRCAAFYRREEFEKKCVENGKDPLDLETVIEEIARRFEELRNVLEKDLEKIGITARVISEKDFKKERSLDEKVENDVLFQDMEEAMRQERIFLEKIIRFFEQDEVSGVEEIEKDLMIVDHYSRMSLMKLHQALRFIANDTFKKNQLSDKGFKNLALVRGGLKIVIEKTRSILNKNRGEWLIEGTLLIEQAKDLLDGLQKRYPDLDDYREKIIFNAKS